MSATSSSPKPRPFPREIFTARAEARAILWTCGEIDLHTAIDELQADAERSGLVAEIGPDEVQAILTNSFAPHRDDLAEPDAADMPTGINPESAPSDDTFAALCRAADEKQWREPRDPGLDRLRALMDDDVSLDRAQREIYAEHFRNRAAESTVEALMFLLRERGVAALSERDCLRRLAELSSAQVREIIGRLMALRERYPAIPDDLLLLLGDQL